MSSPSMPVETAVLEMAAAAIKQSEAALTEGRSLCAKLVPAVSDGPGIVLWSDQVPR